MNLNVAAEPSRDTGRNTPTAPEVGELPARTGFTRDASTCLNGNIRVSFSAAAGLPALVAVPWVGALVTSRSPVAAPRGCLPPLAEVVPAVSPVAAVHITPSSVTRTVPTPRLFIPAPFWRFRPAQAVVSRRGASTSPAGTAPHISYLMDAEFNTSSHNRRASRRRGCAPAAHGPWHCVAGHALMSIWSLWDGTPQRKRAYGTNV